MTQTQILNRVLLVANVICAALGCFFDSWMVLINVAAVLLLIRDIEAEDK